jgi:hypothetical protein
MANTFSITSRTETILSKKVSIRTGLSYQLLNSDFSGNRPLYTSTPTAAGPVVVTTYNFLSLLGGSRARIYTGNITFDLKPTKDLSVLLALRGEDSYIKSNGWLSTVALATGSTTTTAAPVLNAVYSRNKETVATPTADLRYTGFRNLVLYASATQRMTNGDERSANPFSTVVPAASSLTNNDVTENHDNYTLGANWNGSSGLTMRAETFYKDHENKFIGYSTNLGTKYVLGYQFFGVKLTAIAKPLPTLSFTSRYVGQTGKMLVTAGTFAENDSMDAKNHTLSETVDWTPVREFYLQGNVSVIFSTLSTLPANAGISTATGVSANNIVKNTDNNYWTASVLAGFVVDKDTDAQLQGTYYRANNYNAALAATTMPFGMSAEDSSITIGLKHKFSDRLVGSAKIGYFNSRNDTTGGLTNYSARVAYLSLDCAL